MPDSNVRFAELFGPEHVLCGSVGMTREQAIRRLVDLVAATGDIPDVAEAVRLVLEREALGCTEAAPGVAVPHARVPGMKRLRVAVATNREGFDSSGPGGVPVRLVVLILTPADDPGGYLQALGALARTILAHEGLVERLAALRRARDVWHAFSEGNSRIVDYVTARDMMDAGCERLLADDPLRKAIDEFCRLGVSELPVVDRDGDLVGVATAEALLELCLPRYLMWLEDLSPAIHFEPFTEVLRTEADRSIAEILAVGDRYEAVEEAAPAVQVAVAMLRGGVRIVPVTRGRRLVGVITLQDFVSKVMRA